MFVKFSEDGGLFSEQTKRFFISIDDTKMYTYIHLKHLDHTQSGLVKTILRAIILKRKCVTNFVHVSVTGDVHKLPWILYALLQMC